MTQTTNNTKELLKIVAFGVALLFVGWLVSLGQIEMQRMATEKALENHEIKQEQKREAKLRELKSDVKSIIQEIKKPKEK